MAMATAPQKTKHGAYPRKLGRFINLEGGLYGTLDLVAITVDLLELQTGEDFIRFDREQATNLRDTLDKFLALDKHAAAGAGEGGELEAATETEVVEEEAVVARPRRHRRRKTA